MDENTFLKKALDEIKDDPFDRISPAVLSLLEQTDLVIDAHCHIFDKGSIPNPYLQIRIFDVLKSTGFDNFFEKHIENLAENKLWYIFRGIMNVAEWILEKGLPLDSQEKMLNFYLKKIARDYKHYLCTPLMMDLEKGWGNRPAKLIHQQIKEVKDLIKDKQPILPFFAIDPRKVEKNNLDLNRTNGERDLYENFIDAFTGNEKFFGVKVYPALGFLPTDERLKPIFDVCAEKKIPVTTHCGGTIIGATKGNYDPSIFPEPNMSYRERAAYLNHPKLWKSVLEEHKGLKVNFGHFGGKKQWLRLNKGEEADRIDTVIAYMKNPKYHVYSDFSYDLESKKAVHTLINEFSKTPILKERTMFGTDFWVVDPVFPKKLRKEIRRFKNISGQYWKQLSQTNSLRFLGLYKKDILA